MSTRGLLSLILRRAAWLLASHLTNWPRTDSMGITSNPHGTSRRQRLASCVAGQGSNGSPFDIGEKKSAVDMLPVAVAVLVGRFLPACKKARPDDVTGLNFSETLMVCLYLYRYPVRHLLLLA